MAEPFIVYAAPTVPLKGGYFHYLAVAYVVGLVVELEFAGFLVEQLVGKPHRYAAQDTCLDWIDLCEQIVHVDDIILYLDGILCEYYYRLLGGFRENGYNFHFFGNYYNFFCWVQNAHDPVHDRLENFLNFPHDFVVANFLLQIFVHLNWIGLLFRERHFEYLL